MERARKEMSWPYACEACRVRRVELLMVGELEGGCLATCERVEVSCSESSDASPMRMRIMVIVGWPMIWQWGVCDNNK